MGVNVEDSTFAHEPVQMDGNTYRNCRFEQCTLIYSGGEIPRLENNSFTECRWVFDGAALRTMAFLRDLNYYGAAGGRALVDSTFETIMRWTPPTN
jgi:hypothetical protein